MREIAMHGNDDTQFSQDFSLLTFSPFTRGKYCHITNLKCILVQQQQITSDGL